MSGSLDVGRSCGVSIVRCYEVHLDQRTYMYVYRHICTLHVCIYIYIYTHIYKYEYIYTQRYVHRLIVLHGSRFDDALVSKVFQGGALANVHVTRNMNAGAYYDI